MTAERSGRVRRFLPPSLHPVFGSAEKSSNNINKADHLTRLCSSLKTFSVSRLNVIKLR